jgi:hypothetical protein
MADALNLIHLAHRSDRLATLEKELQQQGITDFKIWDAVFIRAIPIYAILQSHKMIVAHAKQMKLSRVMIAEDDIKFLGLGAWQHYLGNIPFDYDLYLGGIFSGNVKDDGTVEDFSGMTLYTVHERFYDTFLALSKIDNIDRQLARKGRYVVCNPVVVSQWGGYSDNKLGVTADYDHLIRGLGLKIFNDAR